MGFGDANCWLLPGDVFSSVFRSTGACGDGKAIYNIFALPT